MRTKQVQIANPCPVPYGWAISAGAAMDIHKPKPVHSWRELLKEVGIIVIGVTIALTGEPIGETLNWKHKVAGAETAMRREFSTDLTYAAMELSMKDCAGKYFDRMETAIKDRRP